MQETEEIRAPAPKRSARIRKEDMGAQDILTMGGTLINWTKIMYKGTED